MQKFLHHSRGGTENVNTLRKQCAVVILTLTLAISAYAGQTNCPGVVAENGTTTTPQADVTTTVTTTVILTVVSVIP